MVRFFSLTGLFLMSAGLLFSQQTYKPFARQNSVPENLRLSLAEHIDQYQLLSVDYAVTDEIIRTKPNRIQIPLPVTTENIIALNLERYDILDPQVQLVRGTDNGDVPQNFNHRFVSYKAVWEGNDRPLTIINFTDDHINGIIEWNGEMYELGALKGFGKEKARDFIVYPTSRLKHKPSFDCHTDDDHFDPSLSRHIEKIKSDPSFNVLSATLLVCNVAVEMDYQAYQYYGSAESATAFILTLFATSSAVYNRDINTMFNINYVRVWTTSADPYTDNPSSSSVLLNEFRNHWNANMRHIPRTIAHYASPRNQGLGGVAWLTTLCNSVINGYGYGFSDYQSGNNVTPLPTYSWQVMVVTHEIGHNFGSPHTHSCYWNPPIDTCYFGSETQSCVTGTGCTLNNVCIPRLGTIMSYCHLTSAGSRMYFGPLPSALIRSYAEGASCMQAHTNSIRVGQPNGHETYITRSSRTSADPSTIITWGTSLTTPVDIDFSPDSGQTWQTIASNIPSDTREYTWSIPYVQTTHNALIRVKQAGNPSVNDISDEPFSILLKLWSFNNVSPANNSVIYVDSNDYTPYTFVWNSSGSIPQIYYKFHFKKSTVSTPVAIMLSNNNGADTTFTITGRQIDSIITSWNMWSGDSLKCHWYGVSYNLSDTMRASVRFNITVRRNTVDIADRDQLRPTDYVLYPCYPNPFNPSTTITYAIPERSRVTIRIYNALGQEIRTLTHKVHEPGIYQLQWDATNASGQRVSSGMYFYTLETPYAKRIRKMTLLK